MLPWFTKYPNQNDEILNLDWVIKQVENLKAAYEAFLAANSLTFADPIIWDITKQYSKNTIVLSPEGDAYLSKKVVGAGIQLNNTDYWLEIFNFAEYVRTANSNLTIHIEQNTIRATDSYAIDDWLLWDDVLYKVTSAISADDLLTVGTNIVHFTVEDFCRAWVTYGTNLINQYKLDIDASELQFNNTMTGLVNQYKNDIDASELAYRNLLAQDIADTTTTLQNQLNQAIAGVTVDSEVINARIGYDGYTYATLALAIVDQVNSLYYSVSSIGKYFIRTYAVGNGDNTKWANHTVAGYCYILPVNGGDKLTVKANSSYATNMKILKSISNIGVDNTAIDYATGYSGNTYVSVGSSVTITLPNDCKFVHFYGNDNGDTDDKYMPISVLINDVYVTDSFSNISAAFSLIRADSSKNMGECYYMNQESITEGYYCYYTDGTLQSNASYGVTDYIPVIGSKVGLSCEIGQGAFFDSEYNYISGISIGNSDHEYVEYTIPINAKYMRISPHTGKRERMYYVFPEAGKCPQKVVNVFKNWTDIPDFRTVRGAIEYAIQFENSKVMIHSGTYDLLSEFSTEIAASTATNFGLGVGKGIHVISESDVVISALYTGNDTNVITYFSPFYAVKEDGGFTLENLTIISSNCRYCVHDEYDAATNIIKNKYINCHMFHDDTGAGSLEGYYPQCIGGGCAKSTYVDIEGCEFYTKRAENINTNCVSYHNAAIANAKSNINIRNCYCYDKGGFRFQYYGSSTLISRAVVSGCSFGKAIELSHIGTGPDNFELIEFCNDQRN